MDKALTGLTLDIVGKQFGVDLGVMLDDNSPIPGAIARSLKSLGNRIALPFLMYFPNWCFPQLNKDLTLIRGTVATMLARRKADPTPGKDFLHIMLDRCKWQAVHGQRYY